MTGVRPFAEDDIPAVAELRRRSFRFSHHATLAALQDYLHRTFFAWPCADPELGALVYQAPNGRVLGFLGVLPRTMLLHGERLRVAVVTQFMVEEGAGLRPVSKLVRALRSGPHDLALSDAANARGRRVWEAHGGHPAWAYGITWVRPVRPAAFALEQLGGGGLAAAARRVARPAAAILDHALGTRPGSESPEPVCEELAATIMVRHLGRLTAGRSLVPWYHLALAERMLAELRQRAERDAFHTIAVRAGGALVGWFLYFARKGGVAEVAQLAARPRHFGLVLDTLCRHAGERGAIAVSGRVDPVTLPELGARGCLLQPGEPFVLIYSRRPEVLAAFARGDAFLSRLEGEWWLNF